MGIILPGAAYVRNLKGAPGIIEDLIANRPVDALAGTLFISTDTKELYRFNGVTWDEIGGGLGTIPTWQQTLDVAGGSLLTHDNYIDAGIHDLFFTNSSRARLITATNDEIFLAPGGSAINASSFLDFDVSNMLTFNIGNGEQHNITVGDFEVFVGTPGSNVHLVTFTGDELILNETDTQLNGSGNIDINAGNGLFLNSTTGIQINNSTVGNIELVNSSAASSIILNSAGSLDVLSGNTMQFSASVGNIDLFSAAAITLNATTTVNAAVDFEAGGGITIPSGEIMRFPAASAATGIAPAAWIDCTIGGVAFKIPGYTP